MIQVKIGPTRKELKDVDQNWVHEMINLLRKTGQPECVIVTIKEPPIDIILSTNACGGTGNSINHFNEQERKVIDLWRKHMGRDEVAPGQLVAFLSQLRGLV